MYAVGRRFGWSGTCGSRKRERCCEEFSHSYGCFFGNACSVNRIIDSSSGRKPQGTTVNRPLVNFGMHMYHQCSSNTTTHSSSWRKPQGTVGCDKSDSVTRARLGNTHVCRGATSAQTRAVEIINMRGLFARNGTALF